MIVEAVQKKACWLEKERQFYQDEGDVGQRDSEISECKRGKHMTYEPKRGKVGKGKGGHILGP